MAREDTDLATGDLFGPAQLDVSDNDRSELPVVLELVKEYEGRPSDFDDMVAKRFLSDSKNPEDRKGNLRYGLGSNSGYGLVDENFYLTDTGEELYELRDDEEELYERFAKYILLECDGLKLIEIVDDMQAAGETPTLTSIADAFEEQYDIHLHGTTSEVSQMRAWLNKAGVIGTGRDYDIDWSVVEDLIGIDSEGLLELSEVTTEQRAFLKALARIDPDERIPQNIVREIAENAYGVSLNPKSIVKNVLTPLQEDGYIEYVNPSDVSGKANLVIVTDKFEKEVRAPILDNISERTGIPRHILRTSFEDIREQMDADSKHERGLALEVLAVKLGNLLGLDFEGWHIRGRNTGGAEVDVIMDSTDVSFTRWQIQCKNTKKSLRTKHVKEEVGVARMLQTNIILMVARSGVSSDARQFASRIMFRDNLTILFLEGDELMRFDENPAELLNSLRQETRRVGRLKQLTEDDMVEVAEDDERVNREEETLKEYQAVIEEYRGSGEDEEKQEQLTDFSED
ncbi:restriction endonuclease [Natronomonas halophila]|uniref:restriction endonuclease n=1 Tax=Natronomonas halophila TaxID=2747817 RepID=UPI0015B405CF|nr:restriction endonuclease [Natronomonas halophila]QLD85545.1 restriction endonuclease [Natronomonas halophila]